MTAASVVQAASSYADGAVTLVAPVFGAAVTNGNLLVCAIFSARSAMDQTFPVAGSNGWTLQTPSASNAGSGNGNAAFYLRTALTTDGTTPPLPAVGNYNGFDSCMLIWEISGANASPLDIANAGAVNAAGTNTTTNLTTGVNNALVLLGAQKFFCASISISSSNPGAFTSDIAPAQEGAIGQQKVIGLHQVVASSGSTVNAVITSQNDTNGLDWVQISIAPASAPSTETGNVTMHFGGIAIAAGIARTETATTGLAFGPLHFAVGAQVIDETATVAMHFGGIGLKVNVVDINAEPSLVTFFTF